MSRFEIQDIISQDKKGIVFRAYDSEKRHLVALRRFFPFGQSGGGLSGEEANAFRQAAQRLDGVRHNSLRSVIAGSVDPIDGMPFIVAEWIDGAPLDTILDGGKLEAPHVIEVLWLALEVSIALSKELGEESVWVETEADSIFVGSQESQRGFVFWLSPFKWLGAETDSRNLVAIAELGERLAGWEGMVISDQAGNGLGGWLKWLRNNPNASLSEALETLASQTNSNVIQPAKAASSNPLTPQPALKVKPTSRPPTVMIAVGIFLLLLVAGFAIYKMATKDSFVAPPVDAVATTESAPEETVPKSAPPTPGTKPITDAPPTDIPSTLEFIPDEGNKFREIKTKSPASLTGVLLKVFISEPGNSLYFEFSNPPVPTEIKAVAHKSKYPDDFTPEAYSDLIGQKVRFDGTVFREPSGKQFVKITARKQITVVK